MNEDLEQALAEDGMAFREEAARLDTEDFTERTLEKIEEVHGAYPHLRAKKGQTWDERRPRYAHNAGMSAAEAGAAATHWNKIARYCRQASKNAKDNSDPVAQRYYREMADAANDAADAMEDMEHWARKVQAHFSRPRGGTGDEE